MKRLAATLAVGAALLVAGPGVAQASPAAPAAPAAGAGTVSPMVTTLYGPYSSESTCKKTLAIYKKQMAGPWSACTKGDDGWYFFRW